MKPVLTLMLLAAATAMADDDWWPGDPLLPGTPSTSVLIDNDTRIISAPGRSLNERWGEPAGNDWYFDRPSQELFIQQKLGDTTVTTGGGRITVCQKVAQLEFCR
ncbi:hypothetical protein [Parahaliea mediterranea]|uniref:hypothetical protein n=1 Tax=Parahaliea mediterranea TaxID=651086 RepID=UPI0013004056|nr:hypothetical protein [Parahaliea mediterranea]